MLAGLFLLAAAASPAWAQQPVNRIANAGFESPGTAAFTSNSAQDSVTRVTTQPLFGTGSLRFSTSRAGSTLAWSQTFTAPLASQLLVVAGNIRADALPSGATLQLCAVARTATAELQTCQLMPLAVGAIRYRRVELPIPEGPGVTSIALQLRHAGSGTVTYTLDEPAAQLTPRLTATPTPGATSTPAPTATPTPRPTVAPTPRPTAAPTATPTPTSTPVSATPTPGPTSTPVVQPTAIAPTPTPVSQTHDPDMHAEHQAMLALVPTEQATHVAQESGPWSAPATWGGAVPGNAARVYIPTGRAVVYDVVSNANVFTIRVDGLLRFATDRNTQLRVDTLVVTPTGMFEAGPIPANFTTRVVFPAAAPIDRVWDPLLLSRGLLVHGSVRIHGAPKTAFVPLAAGVAAGAQQITLAQTAAGWRVGDSVLLTATRFRGRGLNNSYRGTEDEMRVVQAISGSVLTLDRPLTYDHLPPTIVPGLRVYCANFTRNVIFETEGGAAVPPQQRAHTMSMHNPNASLQYASFQFLGRTDKSRDIDDVNRNLDGRPGTGTNPRGRYSIHMHRTGARNARGTPALVKGNAVIGSPGWGIVNHDSFVLIEDNVSYDVYGSHFVTEIGNELGTFKRNLAAKAEGRPIHIKEGVANHDMGGTGVGFWFQSRNHIVEDNVASGMSDFAYAYFHRSTPFGQLQVERDDLLRYPDAVKMGDSMLFSRVSIQDNKRNVAMASFCGLSVIKEGLSQFHDLRNRFEDFTAYNVNSGAHIEYVSHYTFVNPVLIGDPASRGNIWTFGLVMATNTQDVAVYGGRIHGFGRALEVGTVFGGRPDPTDAVFAGLQLTDYLPNGTYPIGTLTNGVLNYDAAQQTFIPASQVVPGRLTFAPAANMNFNIPANLAWNVSFYVRGTKTDSLGPKALSLEWNGEALRNELSRGYYRRPNGTRFVPLRELIADRVTGEAIEYRFEANIVTNESYIGPDLGPAPPDNNLGPTPVDDSATFTRTPGRALESFWASGLLENDADPNGDTLSVLPTLVTPTSNGTVTVIPNGSFLYEPRPGFTGNDEFTYRISDGRRESQPARVRITVQ